MAEFVIQLLQEYISKLRRTNEFKQLTPSKYVDERKKPAQLNAAPTGVQLVPAFVSDSTNQMINYQNSSTANFSNVRWSYASHEQQIYHGQPPHPALSASQQLFAYDQNFQPTAPQMQHQFFGEQYFQPTPPHPHNQFFGEQYIQQTPSQTHNQFFGGHCFQQTPSQHQFVRGQNIRPLQQIHQPYTYERNFPLSPSEHSYHQYQYPMPPQYHAFGIEQRQPASPLQQQFPSEPYILSPPQQLNDQVYLPYKFCQQKSRQQQVFNERNCGVSSQELPRQLPRPVPLGICMHSDILCNGTVDESVPIAEGQYFSSTESEGYTNGENQSGTSSDSLAFSSVTEANVRTNAQWIAKENEEKNLEVGVFDNKTDISCSQLTREKNATTAASSENIGANSGEEEEIVEKKSPAEFSDKNDDLETKLTQNAAKNVSSVITKIAPQYSKIATSQNHEYEICSTVLPSKQTTSKVSVVESKIDQDAYEEKFLNHLTDAEIVGFKEKNEKDSWIEPTKKHIAKNAIKIDMRKVLMYQMCEDNKTDNPPIDIVETQHVNESDDEVVEDEKTKKEVLKSLQKNQNKRKVKTKKDNNGENKKKKNKKTVKVTIPDNLESMLPVKDKY
ncbi:unnamed protein product [Caenorhabditis bovis]|uniref:Uncharacterized protein n=1 Tax=Caenorhabditis bovis TaxID=2654633 RepID=A0A8S1EI90_9PELO|nr:unnamed protein product [Caenorhabditis bovis]